jgi:hypothetical protein
MSSVTNSRSLFEIDQELDFLPDAIQKEIATEGEASEDLEARFAEFCQAYENEVDF